MLYTDDLTALATHLERNGTQVWNLRDDGDSRSLHLGDLLGNVLVVAELRV